jgi:hypothetical protein
MPAIHDDIHRNYVPQFSFTQIDILSPKHTTLSSDFKMSQGKYGQSHLIHEYALSRFNFKQIDILSPKYPTVLWPKKHVFKTNSFIYNNIHSTYTTENTFVSYEAYLIS